jgi:hypothetical protein
VLPAEFDVVSPDVYAGVVTLVTDKRLARNCHDAGTAAHIEDVVVSIFIDDGAKQGLKNAYQVTPLTIRRPARRLSLAYLGHQTQVPRPSDHLFIVVKI